jgi:hypothetical protein
MDTVPPRPLVLAYYALQDPRDLAEALHLAAAFGAEVHLIGASLRPDHPKVLWKLRSWRPALAERPDGMALRRFPDPAAWLAAVCGEGYRIAATVVPGDADPSSARSTAIDSGATGERPAHDTRPLAVLFGEETHGLPAELIRAADVLWSFPLGEGGRFFTVGQTTALVLGWVALGP